MAAVHLFVIDCEMEEEHGRPIPTIIGRQPVAVTPNTVAANTGVTTTTSAAAAAAPTSYEAAVNDAILTKLTRTIELLTKVVRMHVAN